jgi:hypothetical protein
MNSVIKPIKAQLDPGIISGIITATVASATAVGQTLGTELSDISGKHIGVGIINTTPMDMDLDGAKKFHGRFGQSPSNRISAPLNDLISKLMAGKPPELVQAPSATSDSYYNVPAGNSGIGAVVVYNLKIPDTFVGNKLLVDALEKYRGYKLAIYTRKRPPAGTQYWLGIALGKQLPSTEELYKQFDRRRDDGQQGPFKIDSNSAFMAYDHLCEISDAGLIVKATPAIDVILSLQLPADKWPIKEIENLLPSDDENG